MCLIGESYICSIVIQHVHMLGLLYFMCNRDSLQPSIMDLVVLLNQH